MTRNEELLREALEAVFDTLDQHLGDTDPSIDEDMTDEEIRDEEPIFWCCQQISQALKATEPPKAGDPQIIDGMEQHTGGGTFSGQRTCDKCGHRHPIGQRHDCQAKLVHHHETSQTVPKRADGWTECIHCGHRHPPNGSCDPLETYPIQGKVIREVKL